MRGMTGLDTVKAQRAPVTVIITATVCTWRSKAQIEHNSPLSWIELDRMLLREREGESFLNASDKWYCWLCSFQCR